MSQSGKYAYQEVSSQAGISFMLMQKTSFCSLLWRTPKSKPLPKPAGGCAGMPKPRLQLKHLYRELRPPCLERIALNLDRFGA